MLPLYWAGASPISLSPITAYSGGDGASFARYTGARLIKIDHYWKFHSARKPIQTNEVTDSTHRAATGLFPITVS
jgi:hypothetical protein